MEFGGLLGELRPHTGAIPTPSIRTGSHGRTWLAAALHLREAALNGGD